MSLNKHCPRCGELGPATFHIQGDERVGMCANQHAMTREHLGAEPFSHRRLSSWLRHLERGVSTRAPGY